MPMTQSLNEMGKTSPATETSHPPLLICVLPHLALAKFTADFAKNPSHPSRNVDSQPGLPPTTIPPFQPLQIIKPWHITRSIK